MRLIDADALQRHGNRGGLVNWKDIENAPTVDADSYRPHGKWIVNDSDICSVCCPNCGAKMEVEE